MKTDEFIEINRKSNFEETKEQSILNNRYELYEDLLNHYGYINQILKCSEECSELASALNKYAIKDNIQKLPNPIDNIIEEIADTLITIEQVIKIFGIDNEVDNELRSKLARTKEDLKK